MRRLIYRSATKVTDASGNLHTVTFSGPELVQRSVPGASIVGFEVELSTGAGDVQVQHLTRIRVRAGGSAVVDLSIAAWRTFLETFTPGHVLPAAAATRITLPLYAPDVDDPDVADRVAFPLGEVPHIDIDYDGSTPTTNGTIRLGILVSNVVPDMYPVLRSIPMNIVNASTGNEVNFVEGGIIRGFGFNGRASGGPARQELVIDGVSRVEGSLSMLLARHSAYAPAALADPIWLPIEEQQNTATSPSYLEVDSGASTVAADEFAIWAVRSQRRNA